MLASGVVSPAGNVSVKPTPVNPTVEFGLVMVKVRLVVPFNGMLEAPNALLIVGGATTVIVAVLLTAPVPPLVELTAPVVLFFTPAVAPVTVTVIGQLPLAAMVPPLNEIRLGEVVVNVPEQKGVGPAVGTVKPAGNVSVKATPVSAVVVFGFVTVMVRTLVPPSGIVAASKPLLIVGAPITVNVAVLLVAPVPLSFELIAPVVLFHTPAEAPVTVTEKLQVPLAANDPPLNEIVLGAVVVSVPPPQVDVLDVATVIPAGKVSVKLMPVSPSELLGLVIVNVRLVVPPTRTLEAPNALLMVGAVATLTVAVLLVAPVPPFVDVTAPVVLFLTPAVAPVTVTLKVQVPLAAIVAPESVMTFELIVTVPPH